MITRRQPVKEDRRRPIDTQARSGSGVADPHVIENRDDIRRVKAYTPGIKGKTQKRRSKWY
jgi:hypothetical protein